jgi:hypothetical protein
MSVRRLSDSRALISLDTPPDDLFHIPSVDVMMNSVAEASLQFLRTTAQFPRYRLAGPRIILPIGLDSPFRYADRRPSRPDDIRAQKLIGIQYIGEQDVLEYRRSSQYFSSLGKMSGTEDRFRNRKICRRAEPYFGLVRIVS